MNRRGFMKLVAASAVGLAVPCGAVEQAEVVDKLSDKDWDVLKWNMLHPRFIHDSDIQANTITCGQVDRYHPTCRFTGPSLNYDATLADCQSMGNGERFEVPMPTIHKDFYLG